MTNRSGTRIRLLSCIGIALCVLAIIGVTFESFGSAFAQEEDGNDESNGLQLPFDPPVDFLPDAPDFQSTEIDPESGSAQIAGVVVSIITFLKYLAGIIAFTWFIWSGIRLVTAGESEEQAKESIDSMKYAGVALLFIVLVEPLIVNSLYGGGTFNPGGQLQDAETIKNAVKSGQSQIIGLIEWAKALSVFLAVGYLVFSSWKFLQDLGGEEEISKQREVLMWIGIGLIVMALNTIVVDEVLYRVVLHNDVSLRGFEVVKAEIIQNPAKGIQEFVGVMKYFLQFLAILSLASIVYAGILMITGFSNEENYEKGKKILIGSFIGFFIILLSYLMTNTVLTGSVL